MSMPEYEFVIIGSGPAGMLAAITARQYGLSVLVLDEQQAVGGQIFRNLEHLKTYRNSDFKKLGTEYVPAGELIKRFRACGAKYLTGRSVWHIDEELIVRVTTAVDDRDNTPSAFKARRILVATGAMERPMPIPGWTLPGVMGCTSADVLYKSAGLLPDCPVVLAGCGPLLLLIANRLLAEGVEISALLDTNPKTALLKAIPYLPAALRAPEYLIKGGGMLLKLKRARIPVFSGIEDIKAEGKDRLEQVRFKSNGRLQTIKTNLLLLHHGLVPNVQITRVLGCEHKWYDRQRYWEPVLDKWGNTSVEGVAAAGDSGRVSGSKVSELTGQIAALEAARALGAISGTERDKLASPVVAALNRHQAPRPFIDQLYKPRLSWIVPDDEDTVVCRCEEVTVRQIRNAIRLGSHSPDRVKTMTRSGMGLCQGRMCGVTAAEIIADELNCSPADVGYQRVRSPVKPITLEQLVNSG